MPNGLQEHSISFPFFQGVLSIFLYLPLVSAINLSSSFLELLKSMTQCALIWAGFVTGSSAKMNYRIGWTSSLWKSSYFSLHAVCTQLMCVWIRELLLAGLLQSWFLKRQVNSLLSNSVWTSLDIHSMSCNLKLCGTDGLHLIFL